MRAEPAKTTPSGKDTGTHWRLEDVPVNVRFAPIDGARSALYFKLGRRRGTIPVMKARQLIDGSSFGPEALKAIGQAFDTAWQEIAGNFGSDAAEIEAARLQLASALLSIANEESRNAERAALERMALDYKDRLAGSRR